jgi:hypothetical protein
MTVSPPQLPRVFTGLRLTLGLVVFGQSLATAISAAGITDVSHHDPALLVLAGIDRTQSAATAALRPSCRRGCRPPPSSRERRVGWPVAIAARAGHGRSVGGAWATSLRAAGRYPVTVLLS